MPCDGGRSGRRFYRGKQMQFIIRTPPGGDMILIRVCSPAIWGATYRLAKHLAINMPGGGRIIRASCGPGGDEGGTILDHGEPGPADRTRRLQLNPSLRVDMRSLNWVGNS